MKKKPAKKSPAKKSPARKRRSNAKPAGHSYAMATRAASKRRKRKNPAFSAKKAVESLLGLAPGALVGVGGELGLLTNRGQAVAGAVMVAGGVAMVGLDVMPVLGAAMIGAGTVPLAAEAYRMITAPPAAVAGIGSDYAPRAGETIMDARGRSMIADGRGGYMGRSSIPSYAASAVQGAGSIGNV